MKKPIKRLLIISQLLGWSALAASACTDNDQQNKNGLASTKTNDDQNSKPTNEKNQESETPNVMNNGSGKEDINQHQTSSTSEHNIASKPESESEISKSPSPKTKGGDTAETTSHTTTDHHVASDSSGRTEEMQSTDPKQHTPTSQEGETTTSAPSAKSQEEGQGKKAEDAPNQETSPGSHPTNDSVTPGVKAGAGEEHHEHDSQDSSDTATAQK